MFAPPSPAAELTPEETRRYGRHLVLPGVGAEGQKRLKAARILLVGAGGLGSPAALYLAAAGVGTLGLLDFDHVDASNLQRQVLYDGEDVGRAKVEAAGQRLRGLNPHVDLRLHDERLQAENALDLIRGYDLVIDGSDNAATRYLVNDACVMTGTPDIWGAVMHFEGQLSVFGLPEGPCYRCLFPDPPPSGLVPSCAEGGVLGVLPGTVGTLQALEAIKLILGQGEPLIGRFLIFDGLRLRFRELSLPKNPRCPSCAPGAEPILEDRDAACGVMQETVNPENDVVNPENDAVPFAIDVHQLEAWRGEGREHVLVDVREPREFDICHIEGARLIPLRELPSRLDELDPAALIVVHCHHGPRSGHAVQYLRSQGYSGATNLSGGIDAWSAVIDPTVPRY